MKIENLNRLIQDLHLKDEDEIYVDKAQFKASEITEADINISKIKSLTLLQKRSTRALVLG